MAYTTIKKPSDYFNTLLYSGNNTAQRQLTGVGFQPDLVWIKGRSGTYASGYPHFVFDGVRGVGKQIFTNNTNAESTNLNNLYSFDSDGFSLGQSAVDSVTNGSSTEFVSWNWLASNTTASNTVGDINSTVSVNTTSGFSIGTYTGNGTAGATIGHGLASDKVTIIVKRTDTTSNWGVKHYKIPATQWLQLDQNDGANTSSLIWNDTEPTSSVFSVGSYVGTNASGGTYVFYAFAEKKGFSKFGSYTGNGNADGTFVYTGFKPAFVLVKRTDTAGYEWSIWDNKRDPFNLADTTLRPNSSASESTIGSFYQIDMLSQGYKFRTSNGDVNDSGGTYIYMAFAEEPLVGDNPATAR
jgi:hypothetical protein